MKRPALIVCLLVLSIVVIHTSQAQHISGFDKARCNSMLSEIQNDVRKHYYDPKFHGLDWSAEVSAAKEKIDSSPSLNMGMSHIAGLLDKLNDSHTFFVPPPRPYTHDFGFAYQMLGDHCFITHIRPGSDANKKGVSPGDEVLLINGYAPTRENIWKMFYVYELLRPQPSLTLELENPMGYHKKLVVDAWEERLPSIQYIDDYYWDLVRQSVKNRQTAPKPLVAINSDAAVYKYAAFAVADESSVDQILDQLAHYKAVILDLRGNGGGSVETLKWMLGGFFPDPIKIADRVTRNESDRAPMITKPNKKHYISASLVVLIDSDSASAAEIFARTIQLQKRGKVLGDVSSGSVMESRRFQYKSGVDIATFYGASITEADVLMPDGKSLEHVGVKPDIVVYPTGEDISLGNDPTLARAAELCGVTLTPKQAGELYPNSWMTH
ncbi:MAG TPA: S41 family peptidase [Methylomirabilota bacterium]|nr:S41 family peptidase [Methylomirabilota bacterium]